MICEHMALWFHKDSRWWSLDSTQAVRLEQNSGRGLSQGGGVDQEQGGEEALGLGEHLGRRTAHQKGQGYGILPAAGKDGRTVHIPFGSTKVWL